MRIDAYKCMRRGLHNTSNASTLHEKKTSDSFMDHARTDILPNFQHTNYFAPFCERSTVVIRKKTCNATFHPDYNTRSRRLRSML